jgi:hypothetical protein
LILHFSCASSTLFPMDPFSWLLFFLLLLFQFFWKTHRRGRGVIYMYRMTILHLFIVPIRCFVMEPILPIYLKLLEVFLIRIVPLQELKGVVQYPLHSYQLLPTSKRWIQHRRQRPPQVYILPRHSLHNPHPLYCMLPHPCRPYMTNYQPHIQAK